MCCKRWALSYHSDTPIHHHVFPITTNKHQSGYVTLKTFRPFTSRMIKSLINAVITELKDKTRVAGSDLLMIWKWLLRFAPYSPGTLHFISLDSPVSQSRQYLSASVVSRVSPGSWYPWLSVCNVSDSSSGSSGASYPRLSLGDESQKAFWLADSDWHTQHNQHLCSSVGLWVKLSPVRAFPEKSPHSLRAVTCVKRGGPLKVVNTRPARAGYWYLKWKSCDI